MKETTLGKSIRKLCEIRCISYVELAKKAGYAPQTIINIVNGHENPRRLTIIDIAGALGVELDFLTECDFTEELDYKEIGKRIQKLCKVKGMTQKELAKKANLNVDTVSYVINNKSKPMFLTLRKIATALDVEMQVILTGVGFMKETTLGENIQMLCEIRGISYAELAKKAGYTSQTITNIVKGHVNPRKLTIIDIAGALGVEYEDIINDKYEEKLKYEVIGKSIKTLCKIKGLTQEQLGKIAGVAQYTIWCTINNKTRPKMSTLIAIAKALEVEYEDLISGKYDNIDYEVIGKSIKTLYEIKGITQEQLGKIVGVSESTISNIINNQSRQERSRLIAIAKALEVEYEDLVSGKYADIDYEVMVKSIKMLCEIKGITQIQLGRITGIPNTTISNVINNRSRTKISTLITIAKALEVEYEDLVNGKYITIAYKAIGKNINRLCERKGISRRELAKRVGLSENTIYRIVKNSRSVKYSEIVEIARVLKVPLKNLVRENIKK